MSEFGVKMKLGFEEMEEIIRREGKREVGFEEMEELSVMMGGREGEIEKRGQRGLRRRGQNCIR